MQARLADRQPQPTRQPVRSTPRDGTPGAAPVLTEAQRPPLALRTAAGDVVVARRGVLDVPN